MRSLVVISAVLGLLLLGIVSAAWAWPAPGTVWNCDRGTIVFTADGFQFPMDYVVEPTTSASPNSATKPWLLATIEGGITSQPGTVTMTLSAPNLLSKNSNPGVREFVEAWLFNLNPTLDPTKLVFSSPTAESGSVGIVRVGLGANQFQGETGAGLFDIRIGFPSNGGRNHLFDGGDVLRFTITGIDTLTADAFLTASWGQRYAYNTEALVQNAGPDYQDPSWVAPEPVTMASLVAGAAVLAAVRARRRSKKK